MKQQDMRRGTPSAELFGGMLGMIRSAGGGASMRQIAERIDSAAATVSQVEKGQRAVKREKIMDWAKALKVDEDKLLELWHLSQGQVLVGNERTFYTHMNALEVLGAVTLRADVAETVTKNPGLEQIYRLAGLMAAVLQELLPKARVQLEALEYEPLFGPPLSPEEEDENAEHANAFVPSPFIDCYWDNRPAQPKAWEVNERYPVLVPLLQEATPIVRRRGKSMNTVELEDLIRRLSGPERERVRGYVEAIVEQRSEAADGASMVAD